MPMNIINLNCTEDLVCSQNEGGLEAAVYMIIMTVLAVFGILANLIRFYLLFLNVIQFKTELEPNIFLSSF